MGKEYVHYGDDTFRKDKVQQHTGRFGFGNKPDFGLWASPVKPEYRGWADWCVNEEFMIDKLDDYFKFTLTPEAKILEVRKPSDLNGYVSLDNREPIPQTNINFNSIIDDGYDGVELYLNRELYWYLYGWDCDSIVIFNPDVIVVTEGEVE